MNYHRQLLSSEIRRKGSDARWGAWQPTIIPNVRLLSDRSKEEEDTRITGERKKAHNYYPRAGSQSRIIRQKTFFATGDRVESRVEDICSMRAREQLVLLFVYNNIDNNRTDRTTNFRRERHVINYYPPSARGLISEFVERRHVGCQEDIGDG